MAKISRAQFRLMEQARDNRRQIVAAQLSRREMFKMGLLTSAGHLVPKKGLSAMASGGSPPSPPTTPWMEPLVVSHVLTPINLSAMSPQPMAEANSGAGEGRTRRHQAYNLKVNGFDCTPQKYYEVIQREIQFSVHPQLPLQALWVFAPGDGQGVVSLPAGESPFPAPIYAVNYGEPVLVRNRNQLPAANGGFGKNSVTTHLHNSHTPSESDGFPCDFFESGQWYDQHYPNMLAGLHRSRDHL